MSEVRSESEIKESSSRDDGSTTRLVEKIENEDEEDEEGARNGSSSSNSTVEENETKKSSTGVRQYIRSKTPRLRWTPELHLRFAHAVERLGGQERATPKQVLQMMSIKGLSIAHVKSHLQMYRSKKIDDQGQVINDKRHVFGNWDHHINHQRQYDHRFHGYNQRLVSDYSDASWTNTHVNLMSRERIGYYASLAERNYFGGAERKTITTPSIFLNNQQTSIPYQPNSYKPLIKQNVMESSFMSQRITEEDLSGAKRKARQCDLDLNLSLNVMQGKPADLQKDSGKEVVDISLSLSLSPPSKKERRSIDLNNFEAV